MFRPREVRNFDILKDPFVSRVTPLIIHLDNTYMIPLEKETLKCNLSCYDSIFAVDREHRKKCVDDCNITTLKAQTHIQNEISNLQKGLVTCVSKCEEMYDEHLKNVDKKTDRKDHEACFKNCIAEFEKTLEERKKEMERVLKHRSFPSV
ncbi:uncharacterized protein [Prorops nasuta]|uniref:uncharacterized protein n=1 Tax=Prorops nasuta TaxID=863751 RepID=UPI0034CDA56F